MTVWHLFLILGTWAALMSGASAGTIHETDHHRVKADVLTDRLKTPWGMAFLPDGSLLVTEKRGQLRRFQDGILSNPIEGVPRVADAGQGGLLDIAIDPQFSSNRFIYLSFSEPGSGGAGTAVARGKLIDDRLENTQVIYRQNVKSRGGRHFGSRLIFAPDGTLFVTHGDRGNRPSAQDRFDHSGSLIRINKDGTVPADNPFADGKKALSEIWSIGHRNIQGAALHPETGNIWTVEHGARGGDEINIPEAGKNYGWPVISYGRHYSGAKIGVGIAKQGMEQPIHYWDPSIAPSDMTFYTGDLFPRWKGNLFVGALKFQMVSRLEVKRGRIAHEERLFEGEYGRVRDVEMGPDGALYLLSDAGDGLLIRLSPAE